jgi:integrase
MEDAVIERIIQTNPLVGSKMAKRDGKPKHTTWTGAQEQTFLAAVAGSRWSPLWELATETGMRREELCGLTWEMIDLEAGIVAVERSTTQLGKERVTTTPKNHERRKVSIDAHLVVTMSTWRKQQAEERLAWGAYEESEGLVFTGRMAER